MEGVFRDINLSPNLHCMLITSM